MRSFQRVVGSVVLAAGALALGACGGNFTGGDGAGGSGAATSGGSGSGRGGVGSGGSGAGSSNGGKANGGSCTYLGIVYADGATFSGSDGCNTCFCDDGLISCTARDCEDACFYNGQRYRVGDAFPSDDGCNTCSCEAGGAVACTKRACSSCDLIEKQYTDALEQARACDPKQSRTQCNYAFGEGLACGCTTFVNASNGKAIDAAKFAQDAYARGNCSRDVQCGDCAAPVTGYCSAEGRCEALWDVGRAACKVGGVVYEDGATNVPDATSCNTCVCTDGALACTEKYCPTDCPPNRAYGTQCALCGPTDACLVVEHACLPVCDTNMGSCPGGACVGGVCRNLCG